MNGYDLSMAHHLSACGWVFEKEEPIPQSVQQCFPQWRKGTHVITVSSFQIILGTHPWCRAHMEDCLKRGAVGFEIATPAPDWNDPACDGALSPLFTVEWPDVVTRLGGITT